MKYIDEIIKSTEMLVKNPKTIWLGQSVAYPGNVIYKTLSCVPKDRKIELPVFEETQMGMSIGLALAGLVPISVFPRFNFLLLAVNQLVNHLDKIPHISHNGWRPKVIIKTMVGSKKPLYPGIQHCADYTDAFKLMLEYVHVEKLEEPEQIYPAYDNALKRDGSTLIVEIGDYYHEK
jgi:pyruvate/2-oxoglutarate/acetoin dehydrogenase E1 component